MARPLDTSSLTNTNLLRPSYERRYSLTYGCSHPISDLFLFRTRSLARGMLSLSQFHHENFCGIGYSVITLMLREPSINEAPPGSQNTLTNGTFWDQRTN